MSMTELNSTARDLMSVRAMIAELETEAEALTDKIKGGYGGAGGGSPSGGRMESHMEERGQQPVRQQAVQGRPRRPLRPVQQGHHHDPALLRGMREGRIPHSLDSERDKQPQNNPGGIMKNRLTFRNPNSIINLWNSKSEVIQCLHEQADQKQKTQNQMTSKLGSMMKQRRDLMNTANPMLLHGRRP